MVRAGYVGIHGLVRANRQEDSLVALFKEIVYGEIFPQCHVGPDFDTAFLNVFDFLFENGPWQAIFRDTGHQHATGYR
ncbi:hypothetical protein ES703_92724 [subsurface metagenome]